MTVPPGYDDIPVKFIEPVANLLASPLVHIINNCIDQNVFPSLWKVARISPIPKTSNAVKPDEFRSISVLPILSKIYEKVILSQLCNYIEFNTIYAPTKSGFRKGHSCSTILLKLRDDIIKSMNRGEITLSLAADYSKAFDTVNYNTLIARLKQLHFSTSALQLITSYLIGRKQYVKIDHLTSNYENVVFGVPQCSILGPVLFNIYVSDLSTKPSDGTHVIQYADDTTFYRHCKLKYLRNTEKLLQDDIDAIMTWSKNKNLLFNHKKLSLYSSPPHNLTVSIHLTTKLHLILMQMELL